MFCTAFQVNLPIKKSSTNQNNKLFVSSIDKILIKGNVLSIDNLIQKHYSNLFNILKKDQVTYDNSKFPYLKMVTELTHKNERIDVGSGFYNQVIDFNNRLDYYDLYIKLALAKGYIVTTYYDYLTKYMHTNKKVLILRHDIDVSNPGTLKMLDIEAKDHVKATYYFRWITFDKTIIDAVIKKGGEVGLHYETIATYCIKHNQNYVTKQDIAKCRVLLKKEIKDFKAKSGVDIKTVASHGNPVNKAIGIPNYVLFEGQKYSDYGVIGETYDSHIIKNYIKSYICDNDIANNIGFSYQTNPINSIDSNMKVIEFLSHPNHWYYDIVKRAKLYLELRNDLIKP